MATFVILKHPFSILVKDLTNPDIKSQRWLGVSNYPKWRPK